MARTYTKHYGRDNKGFEKGRWTQAQMAMRKRRARGETPETSKPLAKMMDRWYGTSFVERYHTK
jgi:hypothetical protein